MKGLLVALTLFMNILSGYGVSHDATGGITNLAETNVTSTTTIPLASHKLSQDLEKCDKIPDMDNRNLCYAETSFDSFFCDRLQEQQLKDECYQKIMGQNPA